MTRRPSLRKALLLALTCTLAALATATGAQAANVIVGSPLSGSFTPYPMGHLATYFNSKLPSGFVTSPVDGLIVGWQIDEASGGPYYLRLLTPLGGEYTVEGKSGPATPSSRGIERFATHLPIKAGQTIAIEGTNTTDELGIQMDGGEIGYFYPSPPERATVVPDEFLEAAELGFNAEVQPVPTIGALGTTSGPTVGGTFVTITGEDFTEVEGVSFGSSPAPYTVESDSRIAAVAPPAVAGSVAVTVTTDAGSARSSQGFTYIAPTPTLTPAPTPTATSITAPAPNCKVPKLVGRTLKAAKNAARRAHCKVGRVSKKKGTRSATGKIVRQSPKAGAVRVAGSKVGVRLG